MPGADLEVAAEPGRRCCLRPALQPARNLAPAQPGCRSSLRGSSGCPGAAAALLSGLIHILDVQAFGHCPPAGVTAHGCVPRARGASPAACREQDGAALRGCCSLGTRRGHEAHPRWRPRDGRRLAECPGVRVPVGSAGAPRRQRAVRKSSCQASPKPRLPVPDPSPHHGVQSGRGRERGGVGSQEEQGGCPGLKGTASPSGFGHGARVPPAARLSWLRAQPACAALFPAICPCAGASGPRAPSLAPRVPTGTSAARGRAEPHGERTWGCGAGGEV